MTPEELQKQLANIPVELERWMSDDAPRIFGKTAVDIYTRNFQKEGFVNNGLHPWQEVKQRQEGTNAISDSIWRARRNKPQAATPLPPWYTESRC